VRLVWARGGGTNDDRNARPLGWTGRTHWGVMAGPAYAPGKASALGEVLGVAWVVGVGGSPDLEVTFDGGAGHPIEPEHAALALFGMVADAKAPVVPCRGEVFSLLPGQGFVGVASVNPAPYFLPDIMVQYGYAPYSSAASL